MSNVIERQMFAKLTETHKRLSLLPRGKELLDAFYEEHAEAYSALLDDILPCSGWFKPESNRSYLLQHDHWGHRDAREMPNRHELFDHGRLFRKRGFKGLTTWENSALIGEPYQMPDKNLAGMAWLKERGVAVWARADLSLWCPGWTNLVIASRDLRNLNAADYGFEQLTMTQHPSRLQKTL